MVLHGLVGFVEWPRLLLVEEVQAIVLVVLGALQLEQRLVEAVLGTQRSLEGWLLVLRLGWLLGRRW